MRFGLSDSWGRTQSAYSITFGSPGFQGETSSNESCLGWSGAFACRLTDSDHYLYRYPIKAQDQIHLAEFVPHTRFDYFLDVVEVSRFLQMSRPPAILEIPSRVSMPKDTFC